MSETPKSEAERIIAHAADIADPKAAARYLDIEVDKAIACLMVLREAARRQRILADPAALQPTPPQPIDGAEVE